MHVFLFAIVVSGLEQDFNSFVKTSDKNVPKSKAKAFWCVYIPQMCPGDDNYEDEISGTFEERVHDLAMEKGYALAPVSTECQFYNGTGVAYHSGSTNILNGLWKNFSRTMSANKGQYVVALDVIHLAEQNSFSYNLCPCSVGLKCVTPGRHMPPLCAKQVYESDDDRLWVTIMALAVLAGVVVYVATEPYVKEGNFNTRQFLLRQ